MAERLRILDKFRAVIAQRHEYAQQWKSQQQGKVAGYFCCYVPEEVLYALGVLPVRILGSHEPQDLTEPYIYGMYCPFSRDCLAQGLQGRYRYLDALIYGYSCNQILQTYDAWRRYVGIPFARVLSVPNYVESGAALPFFIKELSAFVREMEAWAGRACTDAALNQAITLYEDNRNLLKALYATRKRQPPPVSGSEAMEIVLASMLMDKKEHSALLEGFLRRLPQNHEGQATSGPRLMIVGSQNDQVELVQLIEGLGASVVVDDLCVGTRYFEGEIARDGDPVAAIARRYLTKPVCPQKDLGQRRRLEHILSLAREYSVDGVIFARQKFCDQYVYEQALLEKTLRDSGLPVCSLELDITIPVGQFRTRVEAFLEMF